MNKIGGIIMKIITNAILIVLIVAIFFMSYSYYFLKIKKESYANYFGYTFFEVVTASMEPAIKINDLIIIKINDSYKVGDVITYFNNGTFITHRVTKIDSFTGIVTAKGDANNAEDATIEKDKVLGKVIKIIPKIGVWKRVLMTPKVIIIMFITLFLFNFAFSYENAKGKNNKIKTKKKKINISLKKEKLPFRL